MRSQPSTSLLFFAVAQKEIEQHNEQRSEADHAANDASFGACCQTTAGCCGGRRWRGRGGRVARPAAALAARGTFRATGSCELEFAGQAGYLLVCGVSAESAFGNISQTLLWTVDLTFIGRETHPLLLQQEPDREGSHSAPP